MSSSSSNQYSFGRRLGMALALPAWVFGGFMAAQVIVAIILFAYAQTGVDVMAVNTIVLNIILGVVVYGLTILIVIGAPWLLKLKTTIVELGIQRWPRWRDIAWVLAGLVVYFVLSAVIISLAQFLVPSMNYEQAQDTGYGGASGQVEIVLTFIGLVILAPVAEEVLFRGYLFGKLRKYVPVWLTILIVSLLFAIVHFQWNVGLDVFALSIVLCSLRLITGTIWPSIMLHMVKNGLAFYLLFINPTLLHML